MKLEGKTAIVTGGGTGIGKAIALTFAEAGADVVICSRNKTNIEKVSKEITSLGRRSLAVETDIRVKEQVNEMADKVIKEFGKIDILVNDAAVSDSNCPIMDLTEDIWDLILETNLIGTFLCTQAVAKYMMKQRYGKIINMSSTGALGAIRPGMSAYTASKCAVVGFTKACAVEFGPYGINVNAIAPGRILTPAVSAHRTPEKLEEWIEVGKKTAVLERIGTPEDIAHLALFLASDDSSFMSAQIIACNGGRTNLMSLMS